jgi:hypothetical protein
MGETARPVSLGEGGPQGDWPFRISFCFSRKKSSLFSLFFKRGTRAKQKGAKRHVKALKLKYLDKRVQSNQLKQPKEDTACPVPLGEGGQGD